MADTTTTLLGLPLSTIILVGGLFLFSAIAPSIVAFYLKRKGLWKNE